MNAKTELAKRLAATVSADSPGTIEAINTILKDYTILRKNDDEKVI